MLISLQVKWGEDGAENSTEELLQWGNANREEGHKEQEERGKEGIVWQRSWDWFCSAAEGQVNSLRGCLMGFRQCCALKLS